MTVYLIHFDTQYHHAQHYVGYADNVYLRIAQHRKGNGARLMTVIGAAGITWRVARVWWGADRAFERRLKNRHGAGRFCPICRGELQLELDWLAVPEIKLDWDAIPEIAF